MNGRKELKLAYLGALIFSLPTLGTVNDDSSRTTFSSKLEGIRATFDNTAPIRSIGAAPGAAARQAVEDQQILADDWTQTWSQWSRSDYTRTPG